MDDRAGTRHVDARGLSCPQPVLALAAALDEVDVGGELVLTATDPTSRVDVPVWCRMHRHHLLSVDEHADAWQYHVRRGH